MLKMFVEYWSHSATSVYIQDDFIFFITFKWLKYSKSNIVMILILEENRPDNSLE